MITVILSPHFDDGALSCGGRIWQARQRGEQVRVLSLFAGAPPAEVPPFGLVQHGMWGNPPDANGLRRAEDTASYARLGCFDVRHLDAPDAVYRLDEHGEPLYGAEEKIFGDIAPEEATYHETLAEMVRPWLPDDVLLLAPLGAGHHVDHLLAHRVGLTFLDEGRSVIFYEELPYAEYPGEMERTLQDKSGWQPEVCHLSEEAIVAKIASMAYHRTQIPVLYGSDGEMERRIRAAALAAGQGNGYVEQSWRPVAGAPASDNQEQPGGGFDD